MCGIAGIYDLNKSHSDHQIELHLQKMRDSMIHRGPDSKGLWQDKKAGIYLAHRRLSILDLSEHGVQPMISSSGRYILTYNGEVYNFLDLKKELSTYTWRSQTDTEVILAAFERWGIENALAKLNGQFALACWDTMERKLTLARDRMGEKPLYYGIIGQQFVFASELRAIAVHPDFNPQISQKGLYSLLRWNYIRGEQSIYNDIHRLPPGYILSLGEKEQGQYQLKAYWSAKDEALSITHDSFPQRLHNLLKQAVKRQMIADVPVGAFLSGGIDSSLIVALMRAETTSPIHTYCFGFDDTRYDESNYARQVAAALGTTHHELRVTPYELPQILSRLPSYMDEPMGDAAVIPTHLVATLARKNVVVALSGAGGDELFGGYQHYDRLDQIYQKIILRIPQSIRSSSALCLELVAPYTRNYSRKAWKAAGLIRSRTIEDLYDHWMTSWLHPEQLVGLSEQCVSIEHFQNIGEARLCMQLLDLQNYLPHDILLLNDGASMTSSLEVRSPFLDYDLVQYALHSEITLRKSKNSLKQILTHYIPKSLINRPKQGFAVPVGNWLRGALREWAEDFLSETALREHGCLNPIPIRKTWKLFKENITSTSAQQLWTVLMFQAWWYGQIKNKNYTICRET